MDGSLKGKRSPLRRKPLRNPGESVHLEREHLISENFVSYYFFAAMFVLVALHEWMQLYFRVPPYPRVMSAVALGIVGYCAYKIVTLKRHLKALQLGEEGEKEVGQSLEDLRSRGCRVFHDIIGEGFNIDHVVVSPHGLFVIETKTRSKPIRGKAVVEFDGERLLVNGLEPERNPIDQVRALGRWLHDLLVESTGRRFPIKCAVVFPGWFIELRGKAKSDVWVLNPKMLPSFIEQEPISLKPEDVALVSSRLISYMQSVE
jgi:hypothetical protein